MRQPKPIEPTSGNVPVRRVQVSILIDPNIKEKTQAIATFYNHSFAQHLESLAREEIESLDKETWAMIDKVREHLEAARKARNPRRRGASRISEK